MSHAFKLIFLPVVPAAEYSIFKEIAIFFRVFPNFEEKEAIREFMEEKKDFHKPDYYLSHVIQCDNYKDDGKQHSWKRWEDLKEEKTT